MWKRGVPTSSSKRDMDFRRSGKQRAYVHGKLNSWQPRLGMQAAQFIRSPVTRNGSRFLNPTTHLIPQLRRLKEENQIIFWLMRGKVCQNT